MQSFRSQPLVVVTVAVMLGITSQQYCCSWPAVGWLFAAWTGWIGWLASWRFAKPRWASVFLLAAICAAASGWHQMRWSDYPASEIGRLATGVALPVHLKGMAVTSPEFSPLEAADPLATIPQGVSSRFRVRVTRLRRAGEWTVVSGLLEVTVDGHLLGVAAGDRLEIRGMLQRSQAEANPGQRDRASKDRTGRVLCRLSVPYPECVVRETASSGDWSGGLVALRGHGERLLNRHVGARRADLAAAMLLGARDRLARDRVEAFFRTGTIHLLAISGLHVGMLAYFLFFTARRGIADPRLVLWSTVVLTVIYALVTGLRAPVIRATVLVHLICLGWFWHRAAVAWNSLAAAALVVLCVRPAELFQAGTQLSFLAVAGLTWLALARRDAPPRDALDQLVWRSRPALYRALMGVFQRATQLVVASLLVWTITLPLVAYHFHLVTPVAVPLNVVLTLPVAMALLSGFGVLTVGWLSPAAGSVLGHICDASLGLIEAIVQSAAAWPISHFWWGGLASWWVTGFYLLLTATAGLWRAGRWRRQLVAVWVLWGLAPFVSEFTSSRWIARDPNRPLICTFLSVGHGTAVVLQLPGDEVFLYDAGRLGAPEPGIEIIAGYLWRCGIRRISGVILTHADADHYNALPGVLERFRTRAIYVSPMMFRESALGLAALQDAIATARVPVQIVAAGDLVPTRGPTRLQVLHPPPDGVAGSDNANSLVLELRHGDKSLLLPGDLEDVGLVRLTAGGRRDCNVAMAPHHGSARSGQADFVRWCQPEVLVVSGDSRSVVGQPEPDDWPVPPPQLWHTARHGAVTVRMTLDAVDVVSYWPDPDR